MTNLLTYCLCGNASSVLLYKNQNIISVTDEHYNTQQTVFFFQEM